MSYVRSPLTFVPPQLPSLIDQPPEGHEWLHEVKNDGFRTQLLIERGKARAYTRTGIDGATVFLVVLHAARLPGEVVVLDKRGASDFEALQATLRSRSAPAPLFAFDLLHHDGKDYRAVALPERRERLKELLDSDPKSVLQFSKEFVGDATAFFRACAEHRTAFLALSGEAREQFRAKIEGRKSDQHYLICATGKPGGFGQNLL